MVFQLPDLPYDYDALEPHISAQTLRLHHQKHHKGYVDKLNEALEDKDASDLSLEEVIRRYADDKATKSLFNNAAQSWNHAFFWKSMAPGGGGKPGGELGDRLEADLGGINGFRKAFKSAATGQFGSGWAWLVVDRGRLAITATGNADLPIVRGQRPLLTCDVWEHAYYLDYQNERGPFIDAFLEHLVNWDFAADRLAEQGESLTSDSGGERSGSRRTRGGFARSGLVSEGARKAADVLYGPSSGKP